MEIMNNVHREYQRPYNSEINLLSQRVVPFLNDEPGNYHANDPNC